MPAGFRTTSLLLNIAFAAPAVASESFEKARLLFETKCVSCHCPEKTKGDLLLTTREQFDAERSEEVGAHEASGERHVIHETFDGRLARKLVERQQSWV